MEYLVGVILAAFVACFFIGIGFARDRSFYPTVLVVVGSYYVLFAAMGASNRVLIVECVGAALFLLFAVLGFKTSPWIAVAGLIGHALFDSVHHLFIDNPGVPRWWPGFCLSFDAAFGLSLALLLLRHPRPSES